MWWRTQKIDAAWDRRTCSQTVLQLRCAEATVPGSHEVNADMPFTWSHPALSQTSPPWLRASPFKAKQTPASRAPPRPVPPRCWRPSVMQRVLARAANYWRSAAFICLLFCSLSHRDYTRLIWFVGEKMNASSHFLLLFSVCQAHSLFCFGGVGSLKDGLVCHTEFIYFYLFLSFYFDILIITCYRLGLIMQFASYSCILSVIFLSILSFFYMSFYMVKIFFYSFLL